MSHKNNSFSLLEDSNRKNKHEGATYKMVQLELGIIQPKFLLSENT